MQTTRIIRITAATPILASPLAFGVLIYVLVFLYRARKTLVDYYLFDISRGNGNWKKS